MDRAKLENNTGSKGFERSAQGLARWSTCETAGMAAPSSSYCYNVQKQDTANVKYKIGTWNVRSLNVLGRLANVIQEINRLEIDILRIRDFLGWSWGFYNRNSLVL